MEENIKKKHKPVKSAKLEKELMDKINYFDNEVKRPKRKLKGKEYDYMEPKKVNAEKFNQIGQEYFEYAKSKGDKNKVKEEVVSSVSE